MEFINFEDFFIFINQSLITKTEGNFFFSAISDAVGCIEVQRWMDRVAPCEVLLHRCMQRRSRFGSCLEGMMK